MIPASSATVLGPQRVSVINMIDNSTDLRSYKNKNISVGKDFQAMIRSIAVHNFVHFHEEQRLDFEEGANFLIGGNSTGKTALFELIRRCYSNKINTTTSSVLNENELAYAVCHFTVPEQYPPIEKLELSNEEHPEDILACIFIKSQGCQPENIAKGQANGYDCYKVICSISGTGSIQTFAQKFIGSHGCYTKQLDNNTKGCKRISLNKSAIGDVKVNGTKTSIHHFYKSIASDFESTTSGSTDGALTIMNALYDWLEKGYVGILPMRSIGPLQWTKSQLNKHESRDKNYENADRRAEILSNLLDNDLVDKTQEKVFHDQIVHPYEFIKLNGKVEVSNTERKDLSPKRLLKTPEGILEGKQLTLILSHKEFSTITIEEPDRGMHPHLIKKMRDLILHKIIGKTVLIITHNPAMLDRWAMERTFVSSKSILNETICHSICKVPKGYVKLWESDRSEEMKNLLFSSRILFVEGITDKIIVEAIFRLLIHDDKIQKDKRISTEQKHFLLATDVCELSGADKGKKKKTFCKQMKKETYFLYDEDVQNKSREDTRDMEYTFFWKTGDLEQRIFDILNNCNETTVIAAIKELFHKNNSMGNEDEDGEYYFYWKNGSLEQKFFDILDNCNETTVTAAVTEIFRKKTNMSNKDEDGKYTFYWKNLAPEKRFIDILKKCSEPTVIDAVKEIFRKKTTADKASIDNYLQYQNQIKILIETIQNIETNETSESAEKLKNIKEEKTELEKKVNEIETIIKKIVKRFIPRTDSTDIEIIAAAMINHSEEVKKFIDFCSDKKIKEKQCGPEIPVVDNTSIQTVHINENEILYTRIPRGAGDAENHTDNKQDKYHYLHIMNILPLYMIVLNWIVSFKKRLVSLFSRLRQKLRTQS